MSQSEEKARARGRKGRPSYVQRRQQYSSEEQKCEEEGKIFRMPAKEATYYTKEEGEIHKPRNGGCAYPPGAARKARGEGRAGPLTKLSRLERQELMYQQHGVRCLFPNYIPRRLPLSDELICVENPARKRKQQIAAAGGPGGPISRGPTVSKEVVSPTISEEQQPRSRRARRQGARIYGSFAAPGAEEVEYIEEPLAPRGRAARRPSFRGPREIEQPEAPEAVYEPYEEKYIEPEQPALPSPIRRRIPVSGAKPRRRRQTKVEEPEIAYPPEEIYIEPEPTISEEEPLALPSPRRVEVPVVKPRRRRQTQAPTPAPILEEPTEFRRTARVRKVKEPGEYTYHY